MEIDIRSKLAQMQNSRSKNDIDGAKVEIENLFKLHPELKTPDENKPILLYGYLEFGKDFMEKELRKKYSAPKMPAGFAFSPDRMFMSSIKNFISIEEQMKEIYLLSSRPAGKKDPKTNKQEKRIVTFWAVTEKKIGTSWVNEDSTYLVDGLPMGLYKTRYNISKDGKILLASPLRLKKSSENGFDKNTIIEAAMDQYPKLEPPYEPYFGEDGTRIQTVYFAGMLLPPTVGGGFLLIDGKNDEKIQIYPPMGVKVGEQDYIFGIGDLQPLKEGQDVYKIYVTYLVPLVSNAPNGAPSDGADQGSIKPY